MKRIIKASWVVTLVGFVFLIPADPLPFVWGWFIGGAISILNLWGLWRLSERLLVIPSASRDSIRRLVMVSSLKCLGLAALAIGAISFLSVSPAGFAVGFGVPLVVILLQALTRVRSVQPTQGSFSAGTF